MMAQILVVNDGQMLAALIAGSLREDGCEVIHANDPLTALDMAAMREGAFDLILTDVQTKPISGFEFVRRLAVMGNQSPVLFMSDSRSVSAIIANAIGRSAIIEKPFTAPQLRNTVKKRLARGVTCLMSEQQMVQQA